MRRFPSWAYSLVTVGLIVADLSLGAGGPEGRALSRQFYWPIISLGTVTTFLSYLVQYRHPSHRLWLLNIASIVLVLFITLPVWHFGVELVPGGKPIFRWWVNPLMLALGALALAALQKLTKRLGFSQNTGCPRVNS